MSLVTIHPKRIRWMKNPWDIVSGFKQDNRLKCHRGIVSQWTFQVGLNVTVDETWVDITSRHRLYALKNYLNNAVLKTLNAILDQAQIQRSGTVFFLALAWEFVEFSSFPVSD
jgi:hypothetical protein